MNFAVRYTYVIVFILIMGVSLYSFRVIILRPDVPINVATKIIYEPGHDIANPSLCLDDKRQKKVFIGIMSAPVNREERMAIRKTWGNFSLYQNVVLAFFVGRSLDAEENLMISEESLRYSDIVRGNSVDTYTNLTLKTISFLEWTYKYCSNVEFVMKTDDDVFVNVNNLLTFVQEKGNSENTIFGAVGRDLGPLWWPSKWYVSSLEYDKTKYPTFVFGSAYLITSKAVPLLYKRSLDTPFFKLEDVFITGIVAESLNIKRVPSPLFIRTVHAPEHILEHILDKNSDLVTKAKNHITIHKVEYFEQTDIWNAITKVQL